MAILISTPEELDNIRNDLTGDYELVNDIDLSSWGEWKALSNHPGIGETFTGSFDGKGHVIKGLTQENPDGSYVGLFGYIDGFKYIRNVGFEDCLIDVPDKARAAVIASYFRTGSSTNFNLYVKNSIVNGNGTVGALVGSFYKCSLEDSYSLNNTVTSNYGGGGFFGECWIYEGKGVKNCYTTTYVDAVTSMGFTGKVTINDESSYSDIYFDSEVTGLTKDGIAEPKTTAEMQEQSTYDGWDFETVWGINGDYPYLQMFGVPEIPAQQETRDVDSYVNPIHSQVEIKIYTPPKSESVEVNSHMQPIQSHVDRHTVTLRNVSTYLSSINANATQTSKSVNTDTRNATSFVNPIYSDVSITTIRQPLSASRNVMSYTGQIQANTGVLIHIEYIHIHATASVVHNRSMASYIVNPSYSEVMK